jgi:hypothetical protein
MDRILTGNSLKLAIAVLAALTLLPGLAQAASHEGGGVADEIKKMIREGNQYVRDNLKDQEGGISKDGSVQFWSSGGLMHKVAADAPAAEYEYFSITAKHIKVIELPGG